MLSREALLLSATLKDREALAAARGIVAKSGSPDERLQAFSALVAVEDAEVLEIAGAILKGTMSGSHDFRGKILAALGRLDDPDFAQVVLDAYPEMASIVQP